MKPNNFVNENDTLSLKDYLNIIRLNLFPILLITLTTLTFSIIYAITAKNIYTSSASVKISQAKSNILEAPFFMESSGFGNDRVIANEIEVLKNYDFRERVAVALIDSFKKYNDPDRFAVLLQSSESGIPPQLITLSRLVERLAAVTIEQKRGLDIVTIKAESPSAWEASLIASTYASVYYFYDLEFNRNQLTIVRNFLEDQRKDKLNELNASEDILKAYQQQGGIIVLEEQASQLVGQLSQFESQKGMAEIELMASDKTLKKLKEELEKQDPEATAYIESFSSESYLKTLQNEIAKLELSRDLVTQNNKTGSNQQLIDDYNKKIANLKEKLNEKISVYKAGALASTPAEIKVAIQKIIDEDIRNSSLRITIQQLGIIIAELEKKFNILPGTAIELARLQRKMQSLEKLYVLVEEKYQEAVINEQSQAGKVIVVENARPSDTHSKPNRILIIMIGLVMGLGVSVGYVFMKNYFDNTVKTPEDIQKRGENVLAWIPQIESAVTTNGQNEFEFIVAKRPDSIPSEAFRALRTRIQFTRVDANSFKTLLITSSAPSEGKTMISGNLAGSMAQAGKKTIIVDCDLRKPRMHNFFKTNRFPGVVDYLFGQTTFEEILRQSEIPDLHYITAGTIPPNPSEILGSDKMRDFLEMLKGKYDLVIIDSPPIIAVSDSEILSQFVDATMLVVSANTTELELMEKALGIIKKEGINFIGIVLNNFVYKSTYGSYYKYYYYYTRPKKVEGPKLPGSVNS